MLLLLLLLLLLLVLLASGRVQGSIWLWLLGSWREGVCSDGVGGACGGACGSLGGGVMGADAACGRELPLG